MGAQNARTSTVRADRALHDLSSSFMILAGRCLPGRKPWQNNGNGPRHPGTLAKTAGWGWTLKLRRRRKGHFDPIVRRVRRRLPP